MKFKRTRLFIGKLLWRVFPPSWQQNQDKTKEDIYREKGAKIGEHTKIYGQLDGINPEIITIGRYCVIGAGSVVTKDMPINSIIAGVLAKVIRRLTDKEVSKLIFDLEFDGPIGRI